MSKSILQILSFHLRTLYLFTASDIPTIVLPANFFGLVVASSSPLFTNNRPLEISQILHRLPYLPSWVYINLLSFNILNQSQPNAITEDAFNKPFRAIPSQRITISQATNLVYCIQTCCFLTSVWMGGFLLSVVLALLSGLYSVLRLGEKSILLRNLLNAAGYACFSASGAEAIFGQDHVLNTNFWMWCAIFGCVIFTTIHAADFSDQDGDRESGKLTVPLLLGEGVLGRLTIVVPVLGWSGVLIWAFGASVDAAGLLYLPTGMLGVGVCWKILNGRDREADRSMYRWYNIWVLSLVALPLILVRGRYYTLGSHLRDVVKIKS